MKTFLLALVLLSQQQDGVSIRVEAESAAIDVGRSVFLRLELRSPQGGTVRPPDLRERLRGFSLAEDFAEEPVTQKDGSTLQVVNWKLVPEPCADVYKIKPLTVGSFNTAPIRFEAPPPREVVTGEMELNPKKDLPSLSWRLVGEIVGALVLLALFVFGVVWLVRLLVRRVKEHRMSPIERAWVELDRLLKKGLPGRGRYKDFYVELTMVVRRYVQRKYGVKAPHLTTEEFFAALTESRLADGANRADLRRFLESADLVKFAGVEATPEMADGATESARGFLTSDNQAEAAK